MKILKKKYIKLVIIIFLSVLSIIFLIRYSFNAVQDQASNQIEIIFEDYLINSLGFQKDTIPNTFINHHQIIRYEDIKIDVNKPSISILNFQMQEAENSLEYILTSDLIEFIITYDDILRLINGETVKQIDFGFKIHDLSSRLNYKSVNLYAINLNYASFGYNGSLDIFQNNFNFSSIALNDRQASLGLGNLDINILDDIAQFGEIDPSITELRESLYFIPSKIDSLSISLDYKEDVKNFASYFYLVVNNNQRKYITNIGELSAEDMALNLDLSFNYPDSAYHSLFADLDLSIENIILEPNNKIKNNLKDSKLDLKLDTLLITSLKLPLVYKNSMFNINNSIFNSNIMEFDVSAQLTPDIINLRKTKIDSSRIEIKNMHKKIKDVFELVETFTGEKFPKENGNIVLELSCKIHNLIDMDFEKIKVKGMKF